MDIEGRQIWQQAAGDTHRNYADLCLKWGVILNGPAHYGRWPECEIALQNDDDVSPRKITDLRRFCEGMKDGDLVVLRHGTGVVLAVGEIVGRYEHHEEFNDVDGWKIAHVRRVRWLWCDISNPKKFSTYTLKQGDTTQRLDRADVNSWLRSLEVPIQPQSRELIELPNPSNNAEVSVKHISEYLFGKGVASASISNLLNEIGEFIRIANWYSCEEQNPSESETINYLVVPLLRALGWTPQRMAIEWNKIDIALFSSLPRTENCLSVVVEAKKVGDPCLSAFPQAEKYAMGASSCKRIIVTDGLRYGIFTRDADQCPSRNDFSLFAYMNLTRLRREHPIYDDCKGAQDALLAMAPEWQ